MDFELRVRRLGNSFEQGTIATAPVPAGPSRRVSFCHCVSLRPVTKRKPMTFTHEYSRACMRMLLALAIVGVLSQSASAQNSKPNILLIVGDDVGYGDLGPYGGGEGRGMPTPTFDRLSAQGMTFFSFYAQPSCTPGRAAILTGR